MADMAWVSAQALRAIREAALHDLGSLNMRTVCNIAYGFASATFWDEQLMDALARRAVDLAGEGNMQVGRTGLLTVPHQLLGLCHTALPGICASSPSICMSRF